MYLLTGECHSVKYCNNYEEYGIQFMIEVSSVIGYISAINIHEPISLYVTQAKSCLHCVILQYSFKLMMFIKSVLSLKLLNN